MVHICEWSVLTEVLAETATSCISLQQCAPACTACGSPFLATCRAGQYAILMHAGRLRFLGNRSSADTIRADLMTCHSVVDIIDNVLLP